MDIITYLLAKGYTDKKIKDFITGEETQSDWKETDESSLSFIKNKPNEDDALALLMETGFIEPVTAADGSVFVDSNGALYSL